MESRLIEYDDDGTVLEGYFVTPDAAHRPLVLVAHDWTGRRQYAQDKANEMAERGYAAFALDMYGKGVFGRDGDVEYNTSLMSPLAGDRAKLRKRIRAALEAGRAQPEVDASKVAAIGYCFGGMCVLELARDGADVKASSVFMVFLVRVMWTTRQSPRRCFAYMVTTIQWFHPSKWWRLSKK